MRAPRGEHAGTGNYRAPGAWRRAAARYFLRRSLTQGHYVDINVFVNVRQDLDTVVPGFGKGRKIGHK
jgi:hypothetical protein